MITGRIIIRISVRFQGTAATQAHLAALFWVDFYFFPLLDFDILLALCSNLAQFTLIVYILHFIWFYCMLCLTKYQVLNLL